MILACCQYELSALTARQYSIVDRRILLSMFKEAVLPSDK